MIDHISRFKNGWFIGDFAPSIIQTKDFEVAHHFHPKGYMGDEHYHKIVKEINYIVRGSVRLNLTLEILAGSFWVTEPYKIYNVEFTSDTDLIVIKVPSAPDDKYSGQATTKKLLLEQLEEIKNWLPSQEAAKEYFEKFPVESERSEHEN